MMERTVSVDACKPQTPVQRPQEPRGASWRRIGRDGFRPRMAVRIDAISAQGPWGEDGRARALHRGPLGASDAIGFRRGRE